MSNKYQPPHWLCGALTLLALAGSSPAWAADKIVAPGEKLTLDGDLILTGTDTLEIRGTAEKPCVLDGQYHKIRTKDKWSGRLKVTHCRMNHLGSKDNYTAERNRLLPDCEAMRLQVHGQGQVVFEHCVFAESNSIEIANHDTSVAEFRHNTVRDNMLYPIDKAAELSRGFLIATGASPRPKVFQANGVYRGSASFHSPNWLIGGDKVEEGNLFIGKRTGIFASGADTVVKGNYLHQDLTVSDEHPYWSQVSTFSSAHLAEHNVVRSGHWVCRGIKGEFRYNLVVEAKGHNHLQIGKAKVHHNIFAHSDLQPDSRDAGSKKFICLFPKYASCIHQVYKTDGLEIYNNTLDGDGAGYAAIIVDVETLLVPSIRNNVFFNFATKRMVAAGYEEKGVPPRPARLGYADYNLFFNPAAKEPLHYEVVVKGKEERKDAGFALNDLPKSGKVNEQLDPKFKGPIPDKFPCTDEDIKARKISVPQILAFYRSAYAPAEGSPLIDAGDPADGTGSYIGAVGAGKNPPNDQFGRWGASKSGSDASP